MIVTASMLINYKAKHQVDDHSRWRIPFQFSTVTWFLLLLYHIMVFVCPQLPARFPCHLADICGTVLDHYPHALA
jgi:hypothetical protein